MMDREKEARVEAAEVLRLNPKFSLDNYLNEAIYKDERQRENSIKALRKAGLK